MPVLQNWLMLLSYDGSGYHGWQVQPDQPTIEGELERAIARLTQQPIKVLGAGRTDAGVHALNQTANFFSSASFSADRWCRALNSLLPQHIVVKWIMPVPETFHARHSAMGKRYRYLIFNHPYASPFSRGYSWWIPHPLDLTAMRAAAHYFLGTHDFSAFRAAQCSSPHPVKTIRDLVLREVDTPFATLSLEIEGDSFLQHMVRIITGTLVEVGLRKRSPEEIPDLIKYQNRTESGKTAPACGLYVLQVQYQGDGIRWPIDHVDI